MANNIRQVNSQFTAGDGAPVTGDALCSYLPGFPVNSVYMDSETGTVYIRNESNMVSGDWVSGAGGGGTTIYTGDGALAGNRIVDLDGNSLSFQQGGQDIL